MKYQVTVGGTGFTVDGEGPGQGQRILRDLVSRGSYLELPGLGRVLRVPWEHVVVSIAEIPDDPAPEPVAPGTEAAA